jgi:flagellar hook-associated protein 1 FlgK
MPDLLSLLSLGSNAIAATNANIGVTSNNVANVNTEGYSRQNADASGTPVRVSSNLLSARIQTAAGSLAMSQAFSSSLAQLESAIAGGGATVDEQLGDLFLKVGQASAVPTDAAAREAVISAARDLASGIQRRAANVAAARADSDALIRSNAASASALAKQLAAANTAVARSGDPAAQDQRDKVAKQLTQLVGGQARIDRDGQMRFVLDGGAVLVDGQRAAKLATSSDPTTGLARLQVVDGASSRDVTDQLAGGAIGADLQFRDQTVASASAKLDQVAYDVTASMNAVHSANAGLDGVTGRAMFAPLTQVAGAASSITVDPALAANSSLLALAAPGSGPGDNTGALALLGVGSQNVASGGTRTLGEAALDVVSGVAEASSDAKDDVTRNGLVSDHLDSLRDSLAGVDTQEELTNLARFEHASSAMAKVVTTVDTMLGSLISNL